MAFLFFVLATSFLILRAHFATHDISWAVWSLANDTEIAEDWCRTTTGRVLYAYVFKIQDMCISKL